MAAVLVSTPLALGGVPAWVRACLVAAVAALLLLEWVPRILLGAGPDRRERAWLGVWLAVAAILVLQLVPLPEAILSRLGAHPDELRELSDLPLRRLSPTPLETASYGAIFTCYWAVVWMVARFRRRDIVRLAWTLTALMAIEAFYGLYALVHEFDTILGLWPKRHYLGDATGTYVNRNHFAGLLAVCWPLCLTVVLLPRSEGGAPWPRPLRHGLAILLSLLAGTAIFASHSRLGLLAALAGLGSWMLLARRRDGGSGRARRWIFWTVPAVALAGAVWFGSGRLIERFQELPQNGERLEVWLALLDLPARTWILGAGAGSFADVFKTVQPAALHTSYAYAHGDWAELLVELGAGGAAAVGLALTFWWKRARPVRLGALQGAALAGLVAIAVHSVADFNLQVPGTALVAWTLVGVLANHQLEPSSGRGAPGDRHDS